MSFEPKTSAQKVKIFFWAKRKKSFLLFNPETSVQQVKQSFHSSVLLQLSEIASKMEPIRTESLCLKYPDPQCDGDDKYDTPSTHPPDNLPYDINIGPLPNLVQNEST